MGTTSPKGATARRAAGAAVLAVAICLGGAALAQGSIKVRVPDLSGLSRAESKALLQSLARVNVITSHCPGWEISPGEWMLLTATGDRLAARMGLDPALYERQYFGRAFALLDDPRNCDRVGPEARPLLRRLIAMGGGTEPVATGAARGNAFRGAPPGRSGKDKRGPDDRGEGNRGKGNSGKGGKGDARDGDHKDGGGQDR